MYECFEPGELFVYTNGNRWELGMVKRPNNSGDGYFCWYSRGDTAANTPTTHMHKLSNAGFTHIEQLLDAETVGAGTCYMQPDGYYGEQYGIYKCSNCGELWQFDCGGPKEHGWTCCPKCRATIKEEAE